MAENTEIKKTGDEQQQPTQSERFTNMVMAQYGQFVGSAHEFTDREKRLIRGYFIGIDQMLAKTDEDRKRKNDSNSNHDYDNNLPYDWQHIDLPQLAKDLAHYARIGLDMMEPNTLYPIPYKDTKRNVYTITLMEGYNGIRYQAEKYALDKFRAVTVEVVFKNDIFKPLKKGATNKVESYEFQIPNPFDRGEPIGVFGYIEFNDPTKNKLVIFTKADVEKRKPKYAAAEFWGGTKTVWEYDPEKKKKVEKTKQIEGWVPEMFEKTMKREIYGSKHIPRDPEKIDESYQYVRNREQQYADIVVEAEVSENANGEPLTLPEATKAIEAPQVEVPEEKPEPKAKAEKKPVQSAPIEEPDFTMPEEDPF